MRFLTLGKAALPLTEEAALNWRKRQACRKSKALVL